MAIIRIETAGKYRIAFVLFTRGMDKCADVPASIVTDCPTLRHTTQWMGVRNG